MKVKISISMDEVKELIVNHFENKGFDFTKADLKEQTEGEYDYTKTVGFYVEYEK